MDTFLDKRRVARLLNLSSETLKNYRLQGTWIEGIHWVRVSSRCVRYNAALIQDWISNRHDPIAHQRAIEIYQSQLLSNQKKKKR
ncbi:MAG: hypothetical protein MUC48_06650 [Leptolyngbya sp. Prado105]|jgi:hypothetical protein|nr:hypothetical protein [Leptolyngbya sp. Prado105]